MTDPRSFAVSLLDLCDERDRLAAEASRATAALAKAEADRDAVARELAAEQQRADLLARELGEIGRRLAECEASGGGEGPPEAPEPEPPKDPEPEPPRVPDPPPPTDPEPAPEAVPEGFTSLTSLGVTPEAREEDRRARNVRFHAAPSIAGLQPESGQAPVARFGAHGEPSGGFRGVLPFPYTDTGRFPDGGMPIVAVRDGAVVATFYALARENGWGECVVLDGVGDEAGRFAWEVGALVLEGYDGLDGCEVRVPDLPYRAVHTGPDYSREINGALASGVDLWVPPLALGAAAIGVTAAVEMPPGRRLWGAGSRLSRLVVPDGHDGPAVVDAARRVTWGNPMAEGYGARGLSVLGRLHRLDWTRVATYQKGQHGFEMQSGVGHDWRDLHVSMAVGDLFYCGGKALYGSPETRAVVVSPDGTGRVLAGPFGVPFDEGVRSLDGRVPRGWLVSPSGRVLVVGPTTNKRGELERFSNLSPLFDASVPPEARTYADALGWVRVQTGEITGLAPELAAEAGDWTARVRPADQSACLDPQLWDLSGERSGRALLVAAALDRTDLDAWGSMPNGGRHRMAFDGRCWEFLRLPGSKNKAYQLTSLRCANPLNRGGHFVGVAIRGSAENGGTIKTERGQEPLAGRVGRSRLEVVSEHARGRHFGVANVGVGPCRVDVTVDGTGTQGLGIGNSGGCVVERYANTAPRQGFVDVAVTRDAREVDLSGVSPEASVLMSAEATLADEDDDG